MKFIEICALGGMIYLGMRHGLADSRVLQI